MSRQEQNDGKEKEKKNPIELLKEFIKQLLIAAFRKEITKVEFDADAGGVLGKKLATLNKRVEELKKGDLPPSDENLSAIGELFKSVRKEIQEFRLERDAVADQKDAGEFTNKRKQKAKEESADGKIDRGTEKKYDAPYKGTKSESKALHDGLTEVENITDKKDRQEKLQQVGKGLKQHVGQEVEKARKETRQIDQDVDSQLSDIRESIKQVENDNSQVGKSGLFNPNAHRVIAKFNHLEERFEQAIADNPQMAFRTLEKAQQEIVDNMGDLDEGDYADILQRIGDLKQKHALALAKARVSGEASYHPTDEQIQRQRQSEENIIDQIIQGKITSQSGLERIQEQEGLAQDQYDQMMRNLARRRGQPGMDRRRDGISEPGGFWPGMEDGEFDRGMEMYGRSAEMQYRMTRDQIRKEYEGLSPEAFEDYINRRVLDILATGRMSRDYSNTPLKLEIEALLDSEEVLDPSVWGGITREQREDIRDRVYAILGENDFVLGIRSANREQIWGASKQVGMDDYREALKYAARFKMNYIVDGEERTADDVSLGLGELVDMTRSDHFGKKVLSTNAEVRSNAERDMVLYAVASKLDGWYDAKIGDTGLTDFGKLVVNPVEGGFEVYMKKDGNGDPVKFLIQGYTDARGAHNMAQFLRQSKGMARMSHDFAKADQSLYIFLEQLNYEGDFNDADAKYFWLTYLRKYGVPLHHKLIEAIYPKRGDLVSETYHKALSPIFKMLAEQNSGEGEEIKTEYLKTIFESMLKNEYGALMTTEMILKNWQALVVKREISSGVNGEKKGRFDHYSNGRRKKLNKALEKVLDNNDFDWSQMIKHFISLREGESFEAGMRRYLKLGADQRLPSWISDKGINGFRTVVLTMNREKTYDTLSVPWHDTEDKDAVKGGVWKDDRDKHYDYMFRISKGLGALIGFAENPNWENMVNAFKSGAHDFMSRTGKAEVVMETERAKDETHNTQWSMESYMTTDENALDPMKDKDGNMLIDEEGKIIYKKRKMYLYKEGRAFGVPPKPAWIRQGELNQMRANGMLGYENWVDAKEKYIEHVLGVPLRDIPLLGRLPFIRGFDPFGWVSDDTPILNSFKQQYRWGLGPLIGKWRIFWSEIDKKQYVGDLMGEWAAIFGQELKQAAQ